MRRLYAAMLQCRALQRSGLEAVEVPALIDLRGGDVVIAAQPHAALSVLAGVEPQRASRARKPRLAESPPHGCDLAAELALGNGIAYGSQLHGRRTLVSVLARELTPSQVWRDAFAVAASRRLPVLFFLIAGQPDLDALLALAQAAGIASMIVDASDAVAVYRVCQEAQPRARAGDGPAFIGCVAAPASASDAHAGDPVALLRRYLETRSYPVRQWHAEITAELSRKGKRAKKAKLARRKPAAAAPAAPVHIITVRK